MIYQSVLDRFVQFSTPLEGSEHAPYLDVKGLLTVGIGCLIDPPASALSLPWVIDGQPAASAIVLAQLNSLKAQQGLKNYPAQSARVLAATAIRLTDEGILQVAMSRVTADCDYMQKHYFPALYTWPADAQLCALSVAWAVGPGWPTTFGNATRSLAASPPRFLEAILHMPDANHPGQFLPAEIDISTKGNAGIVPRNAQNELCLSNAQLVIDRGLDPSVLHWPKSPLNDGTLSA